MTSRSIHHFIVYIPHEECYGMTKSMGAFASLVKYNKGGMDYEVFILNEELIFLEDISIGLEEEEF
jgi:hypothetical protein